jgi:hypothetical protein
MTRPETWPPAGVAWHYADDAVAQGVLDLGGV